MSMGLSLVATSFSRIRLQPRCLADVESKRQRRIDAWNILMTPALLRVISHLESESLVSRCVSFHPVHDGNVQISLAGPNHAGYGLCNGPSIFDDVIKTTFTAVVLPDGV